MIDIGVSVDSVDTRLANIGLLGQQIDEAEFVENGKLT